MRNILFSGAIAVSLLGADNIASSAVIAPIKEFAPPPLITPNIAQSAFLENQFDKADRSRYYFVTNKLDESMDKFHLSSGIYGGSFYGSALYRYRGANFYTILNAHYTKANDYKDGDGDKVGLGYKRYGQNFIVGYLPNDISEIRATFLHDKIDDDKQPQHQMDAVKTERYATKLDARIGDEALGNTLNLEFMYRQVEREANNYALRNSSSKARVEIKRKIFDFGAKYDTDISDFHNLAGFKITRDRHEGKRYTLTNAGFVHTGNRFPKIDTKIYQIYDTISYDLNEQNRLSFGLDYVWNKSETKSLDEIFVMPNMPAAMSNNLNTTRKLWRSIYGKDFDGSINHDGLSGALKYEFKPNEKDSYSLALESLYRVPSNMERFNALFGAGDNGWISNPFLKPERHNRVKADFKFASETYKSYLNSMYGEDSFALKGYLIADDANDLVIYDRRHGAVSTPTVNRNAVTSRNVDARLYLANLGAELNFARNFGAKFNAYYSYGQNKTDDRPLYQMRPFEANLQLDYRDYASFGSFNLGTALRYVAKQTRGDFDKSTGFGIDLKEAAKSFTTMDIYSGIEFKNKVGIRLGVNNIFDKKYAEFISGAHVGALAPNLVNAPGRTFWLSVHASF